MPCESRLVYESPARVIAARLSAERKSLSFGDPAEHFSAVAAPGRPIRPLQPFVKKTSGLLASILNFRTTATSFITAHFSSPSQTISSGAVERREVESPDDQLIRTRGSGQPKHLTTTALPQIPDQVAPHPQPSTVTPLQRNPRYRTSFLATFLARQQNKEAQTVTPPAVPSRVLNPINHLPRPAPAYLFHSEIIHLEGTADESVEFEEKTLLTLPEQRRSRQNSPHTPSFQDTFVTDGDNTHRTSIGLPRNRQSLQLLERNTLPDQEEETYIQDHSPDIRKKENAPPRQNIPEHHPDASHPSQLGLDFGFAQSGRPVSPPHPLPSQPFSSRRNRFGPLPAPSTHRNTPTALPMLPQHETSPPHSQSQSKQTTSFQPDLERGQEPGNPAASPSGLVNQAEEPPWGPAHPCYPHLNPHVPVHSQLYKSTRIIRIRRDWMVLGDLAPCYSNIYPEILDPFLPELEFRYIIQHINSTLIKAFDPFRLANCIDGIIGFLTGWFWEDFRPGGVKGELRRLEKWIEDWNHTVGAQDGVKLIPLRRTGYLCLDIQIPDPQVRVVDSDDERGHDEVRIISNATPRPELNGQRSR